MADVACRTSFAPTRAFRPAASLAPFGAPVEIAKIVVRPLVGSELETSGVRRGTRYYPEGEAPPTDDEYLEAVSLGALVTHDSPPESEASPST